MRKAGVWGLLGALVMGWAACAAWADDRPPRAARQRYGKRSVFDTWFSARSKPAARKPAAPEAAAKPVPPPRAPSEADRAKAEEDYYRRLAVCDKLKRIAIQTNDADLERTAEQLSERAWQTYQAGASRQPPAPKAVASDEQTVEKHLGSVRVPGRRVAAPLTPASGAGRPRTSGAAASAWKE
jgi:hypothetical protein